ncbi:MAG TPA: hypothetical protein HA264_10015 [Methanolinea sp.]|nr:hypothetical protein [Methanolinea sp.]HNQ29859.1 hypothetical protein [Methanolinea sp.]
MDWKESRPCLPGHLLSKPVPGHRERGGPPPRPRSHLVPAMAHLLVFPCSHPGNEGAMAR